MIVTLYKNNSEYNEINKLLTNDLPFDGYMREEVSIKSPVIKIQSNTYLGGYNYAYIETYGRYYFINDIKIIRTDLYELYLREDVLMSFKEDILNSYAIIDNTTESEITEYMSDSNVWQTIVKDKTDILSFSSGLSETGGYVLITAGG